MIERSAADLADALAAGETTSVELTQAFLDRIAAVDGPGARLPARRRRGRARAARASDERRAGGQLASPLDGVPIAVKDVLATEGLPTTCGSRILEGWVPPYDATVVRKLREAGLPILGKTNMDEFAMGSSTEHSAYGPTHNPWDLDRIPGGSGGGSAAAVAAFMAPLAIGTDTGGSIRQPGAVTGTVGVKPTYGGVSPLRAGGAGQLPRPGRPGDAHGARRRAAPRGDRRPRPARLHQRRRAGAGRSSRPPLRARPATSPGSRSAWSRSSAARATRHGVRQRFDEAVELLVKAGAEVVQVSCPHFVHALAAYYLILPAEASSNLARFDAMRYGLRVLPEGVDAPSAEEVMRATRDAGFGDEVKRRIILGTYALSSGYYDAYYGQAQKVRTLISGDFAAAFEQADVLLSPTAPTTAFRLGEKLDDPLAMYLNDIATIPANLAGIPGISVPSGLAPEDGLPTGIQVLAPALADDRMYRVGAALESLLEQQWGAPLLTPEKLAVTS